MTLSDYKLLTDENIDPTIVNFLRECGFDVSDVKENGWFGKKDVDLMPLAYQEQRAIVTHDIVTLVLSFSPNVRHLSA